MKYVTFAIMAVLIFGVAVAPVFSNGVAFAQTQKEVAIEKKQNTIEKKQDTAKKEAAVEKKQNTIEKKQDTVKKEAAVEKKQNTIEKKQAIEKKEAIEKKQISEEKRHANNIQHKEKLKEKFANISDERKQQFHKKIAAMKEKRALMNDKHDFMKDRFSDMTPEDRRVVIQKIHEERKAERDARNNMSADEKQALLKERIATMKEKRENYVSPRDQVGLGLAPEDIMCAEDKQLVIRISNGMPTCLGSDAVIILMDRGIIAYPE